MGDKEETRGSVGVWQDVAASLDENRVSVGFLGDESDFEEGKFVEGLINSLLREHHRLRIVNKGGRKRENDLSREISGIYRAIQEAGVGVALIAEKRVEESMKVKTGGAPYTEIPIGSEMWNTIAEMDVRGLTQIGVLCAAFIDEQLNGPKPLLTAKVTFTDSMGSAGHPWEGERGAEDE